jgi:hypothetical protein
MERVRDKGRNGPDLVFLNGVKINEWIDDPNIDLAGIGIGDRSEQLGRR